MVERLAVEKALAVIAGDARRDESLYIAADTVVVRDGEILGKPASEAQAAAMLASLAGRAHRVLSGVCVVDGSAAASAALGFHVATTVWFRPLSSQIIERYVSTGEPMDKAGSYGIQAGGGALVERIQGSYSNVVGLPLVETLAALAAQGGPRL